MVDTVDTLLPLTAGAQSRLAAQLYRGGSPLFRLHQSLRPYVAAFASVLQSVPAGSRVMDIGCGAGLLLNLLAARCHIAEGFGFDASGKAIAAADAARRGAGLDPSLRFERRDAGSGLPDGQWSVVTLIDVMHHIPKDQQRHLIQALTSHVTPGGRLIIRDPVRHPLWRNLANMLHDIVFARQIVHARDPEEIEAWLADSGLTLVRKSRADALWYGYWLLVYDRSPAA